jgi:hypothetical protein
MSSGVDLDGGIHREEQGFGNGRNLRSVVHVNDEVSAPSSFYVREVNGLWLEVFEHGLEGVGKASVPDSRVPPLRVPRNVIMKRMRSSSFPNTLPTKASCAYCSEGFEGSATSEHSYSTHSGE